MTIIRLIIVYLLKGEIVKRWKPDQGSNPEELGSYFEGDILSEPSSQGRNGLANIRYRWPNKTVVYKFGGSISGCL